MAEEWDLHEMYLAFLQVRHFIDLVVNYYYKSYFFGNRHLCIILRSKAFL